MENLLKGTKSISAYLQVCKKTYHKYVQQGLPVKYINGRSLAFKNQLDAWIEKRDELRRKN